MSLLKPVTPEEAKRVWISIPNPSARRVAKALTQSGRRVHHSTVARWRAQNWRQVAHSLHPLEAARQGLEMAVSVLTGDPTAGVEALVEQGSIQHDLGALSDRELLRKASREMLVAISLASDALRARLPHLIATKTTETATLLNAVNSGIRTAVDGLEQFQHVPEQAGCAVKDSGDTRSRRAEATAEHSSIWRQDPHR